MDSSTLLNRSKTPNITPKITKINNLSIASAQARKSSTKLVKVFEKGTYQKKTQLSVLNRYKKRLESIQKQNDRSFGRKRKVKLKMPDIKKYVGNFFTPGSANDPLKAIGALAAFTAFQKGSKGDWGGALGSGLVAAGLLGGGALALKGVRSALPGRNAPAASSSGSGMRAFVPPTGNKTVFGGITSRLGRVGSPAGTPGIRSNIGLTARQFQAGAFMQTPGARAAFPVALPGTPSTAERLGGAAQNVANRFGTRGGAVAAEAVTARTGGTMAAKAAGVGSRAIPLLGTALNIGLSAYRFSQGDVVGGILSAVSAIPIIGWAALGVDVAREFGAFDGTILGRKGQDKLKSQTEQQKALVEKKKDQGGKLTFSKTLNSYGRAVSKFEDFAKGFTGVMGFNSELMEGGNLTPPPPSFNPYTGPISKDSFFPLPGGTLSTRQVGVPGGEYGAGRSYGGHSGQDIGGLNPGSPVVAWKTGTVTVEPGYEGGDNVVTIDHGGGVKTVYKHVVATVANGDTVYGGQQIASLYASKKWEPHLHFEVWNGNSHINPNPNLSASQRISSPMTIDRAKEIASKNSTPQSTTPTGAPPGTPETLSPLFQRQQPSGLSIGQGGFRVNGTPAANLSQARPRQMPQISQQLSYQEGYVQAQPTVVPYPVVRQQQMAAPSSSSSMMLPGPSEQQLLNSFYKRVLLNTVQ